MVSPWQNVHYKHFGNIASVCEDNELRVVVECCLSRTPGILRNSQQQPGVHIRRAPDPQSNLYQLLLCYAPVTLCDLNRTILWIVRTSLSWAIVRYFCLNLSSGLTQKNSTTVGDQSQDCSMTCCTINRAITQDFFTTDQNWLRLVTTFERPTHDDRATTED